jgi:predicted dehydrogenase
MTVSQVSAGRKNRLWFEIDGAKRSLVFDQESPEQLWIGGQDVVEIKVKDPSRGAPEQRRLATVPAGHGQGYADCFDAFVADTYAAIDGELRDGLPTFADGLRSAQIVDAVLRSSAQATWTTIPG